jgi:hypothetical protein
MIGKRVTVRRAFNKAIYFGERRATEHMYRQDQAAVALDY